MICMSFCNAFVCLVILHVKTKLGSGNMKLLDISLLVINHGLIIEISANEVNQYNILIIDLCID